MSEAQELMFDDDGPDEPVQELPESPQPVAEEAPSQNPPEPEQAADERPEPPPQPVERSDDPVVFDERQQDVFDKAVGRRVAQLREAEAERDSLRQQLDAMQAASPGVDPKPKVPDRPEDVFSADYDKRLAEYEQAKQEEAKWEVRQELKAEQAAAEQERQAREFNEFMGRKLQDYTQRAVDMGITPEELSIAGNAVGNAGLAQEVQFEFLDDEMGPAVTLYLGKNLALVEQLNRMSPTRAVRYIEREVMPKVIRNQKRRDAPPPPIDTPQGGGAPESDDIPDAYFE